METTLKAKQVLFYFFFSFLSSPPLSLSLIVWILFLGSGVRSIELQGKDWGRHRLVGVVGIARWKASTITLLPFSDVAGILRNVDGRIQESGMEGTACWL